MKKFIIDVISDPSMSKIVFSPNMDSALQIAASYLSGKQYRVFESF